MAEKDYIAFVVEGESREPDIIRNIQKVFFSEKKYEIITLPAGQNIYMLWKKLKEDDFETDIVEVLRESSDVVSKELEGFSRDDFSEVYLFFDLDKHQNNLGTEEEHKAMDVIEQMLENFDNETENGKLYISYPMVEALRDFKKSACGVEKDCFCSIEEMSNYKRTSADRAFYSEFKKYDYEIWKEVIKSFVMRLSCLIGCAKIIGYEQYSCCTPYALFDCQKQFINMEKVFILSAFPEFLLDYFPVRFWKSLIKMNDIVPEGKCERLLAKKE